MMMDSLYTPACTTTDGIALFCAAAMAALIAVNCADPSRATVMATSLDVAEDADVDKAAEEEPEAAVGERADAEDDVNERLDVVLEERIDDAADADVGSRDDTELEPLSVETDELDEESDWATARPTSPTKAARNCMLVQSNGPLDLDKRMRTRTTPYWEGGRPMLINATPLIATGMQQIDIRCMAIIHAMRPWGQLAAVRPTTSELQGTSWKTAQFASEVEEGLLAPLTTWKEATTRRYLALWR